MTALPAQLHPAFTEMPLTGLSALPFPCSDEVQVWVIPVRAADTTGLNETEKIRTTRFHQSADSDRFSTARRVLRLLAGAYLGMAPADVMILGDRHEKPFLGHNAGNRLHFNMSHSGGLVLICFAGT